MALVAYSDDSDLGTDSEGGEESVESKVKENDSVAANRINVQVLPQVKSSSTVSENNCVTSEVDDIIDEDEDYLEKRPSLFASIPAAKPLTNVDVGFTIEESDEVTDVPTVDTWKVTKEIKDNGKVGNISPGKSSKSTVGSSSQKKERRKVQFFVPALSEFADEDEDEEEQMHERKKLKPSSTGTGLISLLPEPKQVYVKEAKRSLVPHILTKRPVPTQKPPKTKPVTEDITHVDENYSDEDEDTAQSPDFFSLSESPSHISTTNKFSEKIVNVLEVEPTSRIPPVTQIVTEHKNVPEEPAAFSKSTLNNPQQYPAVQMQEVFQPPQSSEISLESHCAIDEEAMLRLAGKRRGKGEVINIIDVSADDALLTRDEWMTKALSEEKPTQGFSKKREGLPTQKQKQKHQITYLAHQAKERELELKNNWAQNRMTKMQTQAKYGF